METGGVDPSVSTPLLNKLRARMPSRRFSQAIAEGDGISVLVEVRDPDGARLAQEQGAEGLVVRGPVPGLLEATDLPLLWSGEGPLAEAVRAGADACLVVVERHSSDEGRLEQLQIEATELGLDCVIEVRSEDELELALELLDPEIFLLSGGGEDHEDPLDRALELLPDVPAGKLAVADVAVSRREQVAELERAGVDAVIVGARSIAELVGDAPPPV
jgi:NAD(P)H-dependent flavin oxidoreductase YrpB (nitropropane dioxygenase family)